MVRWWCVILFSAAEQDRTRQGRVSAKWSRWDSKKILTKQQTETEPEWAANQETRSSGSHTPCQGAHRSTCCMYSAYCIALLLSAKI